MLGSEPAKKVIIYVGEDQKYRGKAAFLSILEYLVQKRVPQANATRGIAGFGADHHMHTISIERLMENLPVRIEFIDSADRVGELIPALCEMAGSGLIEVQDTKLSRASAGEFSRGQESAVARKQGGKAQLLRIFIGEHDEWDGKPLHQAIVESMRANEISGVTVYQGVHGYGENEGIRRGNIHLASSDRPITITVVEAEEKIRTFLPFIEEMVQGGLVALSDVEMIRYTHDFRSSERRSRIR
jgi:PII-like signaling protein